MREMYIREQEAKDEAGRSHRFAYYILVDEMEVSGGFACESYGVKVTAPEEGESASVPNITVRADRIDELAQKLIQGAVSPVNLRDVVMDWL